MEFVDLFAGLGGFHSALKRLGHTCVFACEIDETLRELYRRNFGMEAAGDIRRVNISEIPRHDILCAGFPCQPFSKAGDQPGLKDPELGDLYLQMLRVIRHHHPQYLILENVPNLERHDNGETWDVVKGLLEAEGYCVRLSKLSPHQFSIPQIRERIYIVASLNGLDGFRWPLKQQGGELSIKKILDCHPPEARTISKQVNKCLDTWQEFLDRVPRSEKIPHPLWSMEFAATYPYEDTTPWAVALEDLRSCHGAHGLNLSNATTKDAVLKLLPSHARVREQFFPTWKIRFIKKNREFYKRHKSWLDDWMRKIKEFHSSFQKLEWNCQEKDPLTEDRNIRNYIIQIRPSGVRVKRLTTAPSLVAMTSTQVPIIAWENRYMTPTECKRLQSMEAIELPDSDTMAYKALGNAINVRVAELVANALVGKATVSNKPSDSLAGAHL
jgi:DNA (cytosine-5)-methyltransferase 1